MSQVELTCPHCQGAIEAELGEEPRIVLCPHCQETITLPATEQKSESGDLDARRIQQISKLRRSAYRSRSYWLIAAILLVVAGAQLLMMSINRIRHDGMGVWAISELLNVPIVGYFAVLAHGKSQRFQRLAEQSSIVPPSSPPDFSTLSDGSQSWKSLNELHDKNREPPP